MRILQVSPFYSPRLGGSPQVVYHISRELSNRGHSVTVLAGDYGIDQAAFPNQDFDTVILPSVVSHWGFYFTPGIIRWCQKHIAEFDIIHLHEARTFQNIIVHWFAMRSNIPYVLSAHGTFRIIVQRKLAKRIYDLFFGKRLLNSASRLIAVSPIEEGQYQQFGIEKERVHVIYNGLDLNEFSDIPARGKFRRRMGIEENVKITLYLGRLHKTKGIDFLIEAFFLVQKELNETLLLIAGPDDGELYRLQSIVDKKRFGNRVMFVGPLYGEDKLAAYVDADVLAYPGVYEIFGLVPFEALLCGTPAIVSDDCGAGQLIAMAGAGWLVRYGDVPGLASTLRQALTADEAEVRNKVRSGQAFVRHNLDWHKMIVDLEELYCDLCH